MEREKNISKDERKPASRSQLLLTKKILQPEDKRLGIEITRSEETFKRTTVAHTSFTSPISLQKPLITSRIQSKTTTSSQRSNQEALNTSGVQTKHSYTLKPSRQKALNTSSVQTKPPSTSQRSNQVALDTSRVQTKPPSTSQRSNQVALDTSRVQTKPLSTSQRSNQEALDTSRVQTKPPSTSQRSNQEALDTSRVQTKPPSTSQRSNQEALDTSRVQTKPPSTSQRSNQEALVISRVEEKQPPTLLRPYQETSALAPKPQQDPKLELHLEPKSDPKPHPKQELKRISKEKEKSEIQLNKSTSSLYRRNSSYFGKGLYGHRFACIFFGIISLVLNAVFTIVFAVHSVSDTIVGSRNRQCALRTYVDGFISVVVHQVILLQEGQTSVLPITGCVVSFIFCISSCCLLIGSVLRIRGFLWMPLVLTLLQFVPAAMFIFLLTEMFEFKTAISITLVCVLGILVLAISLYLLLQVVSFYEDLGHTRT